MNESIFNILILMRPYKTYYVYILFCADKTYYTGITNNLDRRVAQHEAGTDPYAYTFTRRPLQLVYAETFRYVRDAINWEKKLKRWSAQKKKALVEENWQKLVELSKCRNESHYEIQKKMGRSKRK